MKINRSSDKPGQTRPLSQLEHEWKRIRAIQRETGQYQNIRKTVASLHYLSDIPVPRG